MSKPVLVPSYYDAESILNAQELQRRADYWKKSYDDLRALFERLASDAIAGDEVTIHFAGSKAVLVRKPAE